MKGEYVLNKRKCKIKAKKTPLFYVVKNICTDNDIVREKTDG